MTNSEFHFISIQISITAIKMGKGRYKMNGKILARIREKTDTNTPRGLNCIH